MSPSPGNGAAPGLESEGGRENDQLAADTPILPTSPEERERQLRRYRLACEDEQHRASRALDRLLGEQEGSWHRMSDRWERNVANQLVAMGWDVEYVSRHYGLAMRGAA